MILVIAEINGTHIGTMNHETQPITSIFILLCQNYAVDIAIEHLLQTWHALLHDY